MRDLFTIPEGEKVTEKAFTRVLVSSVCSVLLCMGCLVGATWAWFAADVKSSDNVIAIATVTVDTTLSRDGAEVEAAADGRYHLTGGAYALQMALDNTAASQRTLYVLMTVEQNGATQRYYLTFDKGLTDKAVDLTVTGNAIVAFKVSWSVPEAAEALDGAATVIGDQPTESTTATATTTTTTTTTAVETTTTTAEETTTTTGETTTTSVTEESTTTAEETTTVTEEITTTTTEAAENME